MTAFCDTSVLIAAFLQNHPHHVDAAEVLRRIHRGEDSGFVAAHSLAETYSVLTRLPIPKRLSPRAAAHMLRENVIARFTVVALDGGDYVAQIDACEERNIVGGKLYDALILACAAKVSPERIYTFNLEHFRSLAPGNLAAAIHAPGFKG